MTPGTEISNSLFEREEWQREGLIDGAWLANEIDRKIEEEREACAKIAESHGQYFEADDGLMAASSVGVVALNIARDVRARSLLPPTVG